MYSVNQLVSEVRKEERSQYLPLGGLIILQSSAAQQQVIQYQTHFPAMGFKTVMENEWRWKNSTVN